MKYFFTASVFFLTLHTASSQQSLALYNMRNIGSCVQVNPSLLPDNRMYVGIPGLSSLSLNLTNSAFAYRDLHSIRSDDSIVIDVENIKSQMSDDNRLGLALR